MTALGLLRAAAFATTTAVALVLAAPTDGRAQASDAPVINPEELDQAQLSAFAAAAVRVGEIMRDWEGQLATATDEADEARMREEMSAEMVAAVEDEGLTVDEYNMIFQVAQIDPEVNATVVEMMERMGGG